MRVGVIDEFGVVVCQDVLISALEHAIVFRADLFLFRFHLQLIL